MPSPSPFDRTRGLRGHHCSTYSHLVYDGITILRYSDTLTPEMSGTQHHMFCVCDPSICLMMYCAVLYCNTAPCMMSRYSTFTDEQIPPV